LAIHAKPSPDDVPGPALSDAASMVARLSDGSQPQPRRRFGMKTIATALMCACVTLAAGNAAAQDTMKKSDSMASPDKKMSMQECKDHMAMSKKAGAKKDDAMMKKDANCDEMVKKGDPTLKNDGMLKKDKNPGDSMK
jgi:hypothetical protein